MKILKSRLFLGVISIALGLLVAFVLAPLYQSAQNRTGVVVKAREFVKKGTLITADLLEEVTVGMQGQSEELLMTLEEAEGKFITVDVMKGDFVTQNKLSEKYVLSDEYIKKLSDGEAAVSITLADAKSVASKIRDGDIVQIVGVSGDNDEEGKIYESLQAIEVLSVTNKELYDIEKDAIEEIKIITVKAVDPYQIAKIAELENSGKAHAAIIYRGDDKERRNKILDAQKEVLIKLNAEEQKKKKSEESKGSR